MKIQDIYKFIIVDENECWNWTRATYDTGYGCVNALGKSWLAHRLSYEISKGPIPKDLYVCHNCDNRRCINPDHLFVGTQKDNMQDALKKGRTSPPPRNVSWMARFPERVRRGADAARAKLNDELVLRLMQKRAAGFSYGALAEEFGIDKSVVGDISNGKCWRHILDVPGAPTVEEMQAARNFRSGAKITPDVAREIKNRLAKGETGRSIAKRFGIHFASVSDIKRGLTWQDV